MIDVKSTPIAHVSRNKNTRKSKNKIREVFYIWKNIFQSNMIHFWIGYIRVGKKTMVYVLLGIFVLRVVFDL